MDFDRIGLASTPALHGFRRYRPRTCRAKAERRRKAGFAPRRVTTERTSIGMKQHRQIRSLSFEVAKAVGILKGTDIDLRGVMSNLCLDIGRDFLTYV